MKIYYDADLDTRSFEGRTTIAGKIKSFLEKEGFSFVDHPSQADLIHVHSSGIGESYQAYKNKKKYGIPCIYSLYSNSQTEPINHIRNFLLQSRVLEKGATSGWLSYSAIIPLRLRAIFLTKLDKVVVPSQHIKSRLGGKNSALIRFGIDTTKFKPIKQKNNRNSTIKVAFFGHPGVFKGQTDFIRASKHFAEHIEAHMFFTNPSKKTDNYIKKNNPNIQIHGYVDDIVKTYNEMDIIVLPYRNPLGAIANPLILLEAMSCGKAVITTNLPFLKEIVQDAALTVRPYTPKELAKAVNWLSHHPEKRAELGLKAREVIIKNHHQEKMFADYLELYQKIKTQHQQ